MREEIARLQNEVAGLKGMLVRNERMDANEGLLYEQEPDEARWNDKRTVLQKQIRPTVGEDLYGSDSGIEVPEMRHGESSRMGSGEKH